VGGNAYRADRHVDSSGLGRGLYIAREVALAYDGTFEVLSEAVVGATFIVRLPGDLSLSGVKMLPGAPDPASFCHEMVSGRIASWCMIEK
jgi:hypothetical protein